MKVNIRAFGIAKEIVGGQNITLELEPSSSAQQLQKKLFEIYPDFKGLSSIKLAINEAYSQGDELITEEDDIAIIPPVSGG